MPPGVLETRPFLGDLNLLVGAFTGLGPENSSLGQFARALLEGVAAAFHDLYGEVLAVGLTTLYVRGPW